MNKIGLSGFFDIVKKDKDGNIIEQYHFENLILNSGLDFIGANAGGVNYIDKCFVGSGNSEPNITQRSLDNIIGTYSSSNTYNEYKTLTDDETSISYVRKFRFNENEANGNISEIGVGEDYYSYHTLFCRTLIKDPSGRPTVITKLQGEILEITYTLKVSVNTQDKTGTMQLGDKQYRYTARISRQDNNVLYTAFAYDGNISNIDNYPKGNYASIARSFGIYENGNYHIDVNVGAIIDLANFETGIRSIYVRGLFNWWWQIEFIAIDDETAIQKDNTQQLNIVLNQAWGRKE